MEGNIDANDFHGWTSRSTQNDRSHHPISRVKEARKLDRPIEIPETKNRLLLANLEGLDDIQSSASNDSNSYEIYALHGRAINS